MHVKRLKNERGFTLLELLMVVVILAILAAIAVPQYIKTSERARMAEALSNLSSLRQSAIRLRAETGTFAPGGALTIGTLDFNPTEGAGAGALRFAYAVSCADADEVVFTATRLLVAGGAPEEPPVACGADPAVVDTYVIAIDEAGNISGRGCTAAAAGPTCT